MNYKEQLKLMDKLEKNIYKKVKIAFFNKDEPVTGKKAIIMDRFLVWFFLKQFVECINEMTFEDFYTLMTGEVDKLGILKEYMKAYELFWEAELKGTTEEYKEKIFQKIPFGYIKIENKDKK